MQQHSVPQNVTQYQFRLVGDMTLKQFLELAGGLVLAYLFYASNLIVVIKWPFALLSIFFGIALAFFPIEERPLDVWIINFLKSIYAPTRYIWKKTNKVPQIFLFQAHQDLSIPTVTKTVKAPSHIFEKPTPKSDLGEDELKRIMDLDLILKEVAVVDTAKTAPVIERPSITVRKLTPLDVSLKGISAPPLVSVPAIKPIRVETPASPTQTQDSTSTVIFEKPTVKNEKVDPTGSVGNIKLPASPKLPNLVSGMVVNKEGKIIDNAIVQILSSAGAVERAIKTNSLGQFYTSTPLRDGEYVVEVEASGHTFVSKKLEVKSAIIPPLLLTAS